MPEIGATLREARMRAGIDIAEVESRTKIRAKYLRALENEEWGLLPGTTFVKSFLRTYAEALGLDAKLLVEEYKFRHEPYELGGASGVVQRQGGRRGRRGRHGAFGPPKRTGWLPLLALVLLIALLLFGVYRLSQGEDEANQPPVVPTTTTTAEDAADAKAAEQEQRRREQRAAARMIVKLRVQATAASPTSVCIRDARGRRVVNGQTLQPGRRTSLLRSKQFDIVIGAPTARVTDGGRALQVRADDRNVIAYRITKDEVRRLPEGQRPACS